MKLELLSNIFSKNKGENGGALYFGMEKNNDVYENRTLNIEDNIFTENEAFNFGGAIYSEYNKLKFASINNNKISHNVAGIMGGGIYSKNAIDLAGYEFYNNTNNSILENYISKPSYINLNTKLSQNIELNVGEYLPLAFTLYDDFGNLIIDITKYYLLLTIKLVLIKDNDNLTNDEINNHYLIGNIGSFIKGILLLLF